jgi:hypothetical protein
LKLDEAWLFVPAASLAADVTLTASASPASADTPEAAKVYGSVYEFGPTGTQFTSPAYLALPVDVPSQKRAVVVRRSTGDSAWTRLPTAVFDGHAYAAVSHFTSFAVLLEPASDACTNYDATCGTGDVEGTWDVQDFCNGTSIPEGGGPVKLLPKCADDKVASTEFASAGGVTLNADRTYSSAIVTPFPTVATATVPGSCAANAGETADAMAAEIVGDRSTYLAATCTKNGSDYDCQAVHRPSPAVETPATGNYQLSNGKLGFAGIPQRAYCVPSAGELFYDWGTSSGQAPVHFGFVMTKR